MNQFRMRTAAALFAVAMLIVGTSIALSQSITSTSDVRIVAQKLEDGRIEFALEQDGERILPSTRFFPADARVGRWLKSSHVSVDVEPEVATEAITETAEVPATDGTVSETQGGRSTIEFPRPDLLSQSLINRALDGATGIAFEARGHWWVLVDLRSENFVGDAYACNGDGLVWKGLLWTDDLAVSDENTFNSWELSTWAMSYYHSSTDSAYRQLAQLCSPLTNVDLGSSQKVTISIPHRHGESAPPLGEASVATQTTVTVRGTGENAKTFTLSEGDWFATMNSAAACSMWIEGAAKPGSRNIGELDWGGGRTTYTGVVTSTGGTVWTDPIGCDGSWTITFTPLN